MKHVGLYDLEKYNREDHPEKGTSIVLALIMKILHERPKICTENITKRWF